MGLFSVMKSYFTKEFYDFDSPDLNLYNFHPQLRICLSINGIFFNNRNSRLRFISPVLNSSLSIVAIVFQMMLLYRGVSIKDYAMASEAFCYLIILGTIPIVYISVLCNREVIFSLLNDMNDDFIYICKLGPKYRDHFLSGQLIIWKMWFLWLSFCSFTAVSYVCNNMALTLYQSIFATKDEYTTRPLIFPLWLPKDDPYKTPNYETFLLIEIYVILIIVQNFGSYVYTQFHYLLHYYYIMDMIILDLEVIFDGHDDEAALLPRGDPRRIAIQRMLNNKIKRIVDWHNSVFKSVKTVSSIYGPPLVYLVMLSSLIICIMAYQVIQQLENGKIEFMFGVLWVGAVMQLWIPCYLGTLISNKAYSVGDACWESGWQNTPLARMLRTDLIIVILRAQRPLYIKFVGLPYLNLGAFSSNMSKSYTYFNMLRQSTNN